MEKNPDKLYVLLCRLWLVLAASLVLCVVFQFVTPILNLFTADPKKEEVFDLYESNKETLNEIVEYSLSENYEDFFIRSEYDDEDNPHAAFIYDYIEVDDELIDLCNLIIANGDFFSIYRHLDKDDMYYFRATSVPHIGGVIRGLVFCMEPPKEEGEIFEHIEGNWYYYEEIE